MFAVFEREPESVSEDLPQEVLAGHSERRQTELVAAGGEVHFKAVVRRGVHKVAGAKRAMLRFLINEQRGEIRFDSGE